MVAQPVCSAYLNTESPSARATGVDVVLSIVFGGGFALQTQLIEAARLAGVKRFVPSEFGVPLNILECAL